MPRGKKRTTQSGADAQNIKSVPGQRYGEGVEQQALQRDMPAPNLAADNAPKAAPAPVAPSRPVRPTPRADPASVQQFLGSHKPALLSGTQMPQTPVTDGLPGGPGRGPEALIQARATTPIARYMETLSAETGNPKWKHLAERAGLR